MPSSDKRVRIKRVYEPPARTDGTRVLVDRLWPRGLTKQRASLDAWLRDLAPSNTLRQWFHSHPDQWPEFRRKYLKELSRPEAAESLEELYQLAHGKRPLTLLFASKMEDRNNATVLQEILNGTRKPPTGTGPGGAKATQHREAKRLPRA